MAQAAEAELVFVVDVSSFTKKGFLGSTKYEGKPIALEFDDEGKGVFINAEMAKKIHVRRGSQIIFLIENERLQEAKTTVAGVGTSLRISDAKTYYAVGKEGGAIIRVRKATPA
ncbi:MAG: hypothetical protein OK404_00895 [Thaumarchaeota archaeon]|nr:hypothetical protein [Nitrososphaerota archaeon]